MKPALCIVVPVLNEALGLAPRLLELQKFRRRGARLMVVDGGSDDDTLNIARTHADLAFIAPRGRAAQMNAGAAACPADTLLFVHADTCLPDDADTLVAHATSAPFAWGRFDVRIDSHRFALRAVECLMNLRSRWTGIATGDQAVFVRHELFRAVGGFPDIPLMEDIAMSASLEVRAAGLPARAGHHLGAALGKQRHLPDDPADVAAACCVLSGRRSGATGPAIWLSTTATRCLIRAMCRSRCWPSRPSRAWPRHASFQRWAHVGRRDCSAGSPCERLRPPRRHGLGRSRSGARPTPVTGSSGHYTS